MDRTGKTSRASSLRTVFLAGIVCATASFGSNAEPQRPAQTDHRAGFVPVSDEVFAVVRQFYDYDLALPLDPRVIDRWNEDGIDHETIVFTTSSGERVPGDLVLPREGRRPTPVVLLVHGLGNDRDRWWEPDRRTLPANLLDAGVAVMTIDLRFHGARSAANDYQNPVYLTMGNELFVRNRDMLIQSTIDCRRALDVLVARDDIDASRIAVAGYSMGGMIALYLSALEPGLVAVVAAAVPTGEQPLPIDPFNFAPRAIAPVLLQIGRSDWLSSPNDAERLRELVGSGQGNLRLYDAGHNLPPDFATDAANWLRSRLD